MFGNARQLHLFFPDIEQRTPCGFFFKNVPGLQAVFISGSRFILVRGLFRHRSIPHGLQAGQQNQPAGAQCHTPNTNHSCSWPAGYILPKAIKIINRESCSLIRTSHRPLRSTLQETVSKPTRTANASDIYSGVFGDRTKAEKKHDASRFLNRIFSG